jgi:hypothetical protein
MSRTFTKAGLAFVTILVLIGTTTSQAKAATQYSSGCPGPVGYGRTGGDYRDVTGQGATDWIVSPGLTIRRASASCWSGTQVVSAVMRNWGYHPDTRTWRVDNTATLQGPISLRRGYYDRVPPSLWEPPRLSVSVDVIIYWRTPGGVLIGKSRIDYNTVADYYTTNNNAVSVFPNSAVGAYLHWWQ